MKGLGDLTQRSNAELNAALADLDRMRKLEARNWQALQAGRRANAARIHLDEGFYVARLLAAATDKQAELDRINNEEDKAFRARYGFPLPGRFLIHTPDQANMVAKWYASNEAKPYEERRRAVEASWVKKSGHGGKQQVLSGPKPHTSWPIER